MTSPPPDPTRATDFVLRRLARAVRFRDEETAEHGERVSRSAELIAKELGWDAKRTGTLRAASALHDIGKIGIPEAILRKAGPLAPAERKLVESHTEIGYELLACTTDPQFDVAARIALSHHERVDGSGYPHGLQGDAIPIEARVVAVADAFDALTHARFDRPAFSESEAVELMRARRGRKFDGGVFEAFQRVLPELAGETGGPAPGPRLESPGAASASTPRLTPREREVVRLLATGLNGEEIAQTLVVSPETVRTHVRNAMQRMGARTRTHLVSLALQGQEVTV